MSCVSTPVPAPKQEKKQVPVNFRIGEAIVSEMDKVVMRDRSTRSEFLREAIVEKLKKEAA